MVPNKEWALLVGTDSSDYMSSVVPDSHGGIYAAGSTVESIDGENRTRGFITHYDITGNKSWTRRLIGSSSYEYITGAVPDRNSGIFVAGYTNGSIDDQTNNGETDGFVAHYDSAGNKRWTRLIGSSSWDEIKSVTADGNGGIFVAGSAMGIIDGQTHSGSYDGFIAHYDSSGNKSWTRIFGSDSYDEIGSIIADGSGGIYVYGNTDDSFDDLTISDMDGFIAHYDSSGSKSWIRRIGTDGWDKISGITSDESGGIFVAGYTNGNLDGQSNNGYYSDGFITYYDSSGNKSWTRLIGSGLYGIEEITKITSDGNGGVFVAGKTNGSIDDQIYSGGGDSFIAHYDSSGNKTWIRVIGSSGYDYIGGIIADGFGGLFVAEHTQGFIAHYDSSGNKSWTIPIDFDQRYPDVNLTVDENGGLIVSGNTARQFDGQAIGGYLDGFIVRLTDDTIVAKDQTPPTLTSTAATNNQLILTFSEDIQVAGGGSLNPAYMTVTVDGQIRRVTKSQITPPDQPSIHTASQLALTLLGSPPNRASSISISYNPPTNGSNQGFITDLSNNPLASIASQVVDTFSASTSIGKSGIASAYKNLILTGSAPITGFGNSQNNTITGNDANNILDGLAGADTMIGGLGDDTYVVDNVGDVITELAAEGTDTVQSSITYTLADNLENLTLLGSAAINGTGNTANNILTGNTGANVLNGNGGTDTLIGGRGNDTYVVDSIDDIITETGTSSDVDSVQSSASWILGANLENLTLTGTSAINGTGNTLNNAISGNNANNILDGGNGGIDRLTGLAGADTFRFSTRPSSFRNTTADRITDFSSAQADKIQIAKNAFGITTSTATLNVVSNSTAVNTALSSASLFVYNTSNGELHWNQNGITKGAGTGGVLAILDNRATLSAGDLLLV